MGKSLVANAWNIKLSSKKKKKKKKKQTILRSYLLMVIWVARQCSVNVLVSVVKDTYVPTVWSDGRRNKYDPG